jgi:hypothetical protein
MAAVTVESDGDGDGDGDGNFGLFVMARRLYTATPRVDRAIPLRRTFEVHLLRCARCAAVWLARHPARRAGR